MAKQVMFQETSVDDTWDYNVVGAGAAGSVVANHLSAFRGNRVLPLEEVLRDTAPAIHGPGGFVSPLGSELDWKFTPQPQVGWAKDRDILAGNFGEDH